MTQRIASLRMQGRNSEIHDVVLSGIIFEILTGAILSLVCFAIAQHLAIIISAQTPADAPRLSLYISIMSLSIFAGALLSAVSAIFTGFERMKLNSFTQIFQASVKTGLGPLLIFLGFGVLGAIYADALSFVGGGVVGVFILFFVLCGPLRKCKSWQMRC